jgi:hypothetical protein
LLQVPQVIKKKSENEINKQKEKKAEEELGFETRQPDFSVPDYIPLQHKPDPDVITQPLHYTLGGHQGASPMLSNPTETVPSLSRTAISTTDPVGHSFLTFHLSSLDLVTSSTSLARYSWSPSFSSFSAP